MVCMPAEAPSRERRGCTGCSAPGHAHEQGVGLLFVAQNARKKGMARAFVRNFEDRTIR